MLSEGPAAATNASNSAAQGAFELGQLLPSRHEILQLLVFDFSSQRSAKCFAVVQYREAIADR